MTDTTCTHDWRWDGDEPRLVCKKCGDLKDAHTGKDLAPHNTHLATLEERLNEMIDDYDHPGYGLRGLKMEVKALIQSELEAFAEEVQDFVGEAPELGEFIDQALADRSKQ